MNRDNLYLKGNKHAVGSKPNRTAFKEGHIPWNKDKKGIHLSAKTEFKKGAKPVNWVGVSTIRTRNTDKGKRQRNFIKISRELSVTNPSQLMKKGRRVKNYLLWISYLVY